ncbi:MAG: hypothetical protein HYV09_28540 [Deltaproteobacteria bacterium]|nr:hypothetical protein [Deltaproteobacteria bacterium]
MSSSTPTEPVESGPPETWPHHDLRARIVDALAVMPAYFKPETHIEGINALDLHTLNSVLGATIEDQAVATLNSMRAVWDPDKRYSLYTFVRQAQTFPDVLLRRAPGATAAAAADDILLGIELKGWFVLAKEGMPNFRFAVTPAACAPADLLVVVPWALSQVISGRPIMFSPYTRSARYAAERRNHWWEHQRKAKGITTITRPAGARPYPSKADRIDDQADADGGGNFGRFARTGLMDEYIGQIHALSLCGVPIQAWLKFFQALGGRED